MPEHLLFLTGKLAAKQLHQILEDMQPTEFSYKVEVLGLTVAALMTADMLRRRLKDTDGADRIIVPGRCRGDLDSLSADLGVPVVRGPEELKDLPAYFGREQKKPDLSQYEVQIFAEIVDAPNMTIDEIIAQAESYRADGADVIDVGCLPDTPFPHMEDSIRALKDAGFRVSIDSLDNQDLVKGGKAGADFMLSLHEDSLWVLEEVPSTPILIPKTHGDLDSLDRAIAAVEAVGRSYMIDPILDPIHFGFVDSIVRYREARRRHPEAEIFFGVGNVTELTHADTSGINAILLGMCSELGAAGILTTQVSAHARLAIREADRARRIMLAARRTNSLPKHIDDSLMTVHDKAPYPYSASEIAELATQIRDPSYRIQTSSEGIHIYNRDGLQTATDPFDLFPGLGVETDGGHAFYLGVQLGRAQISWHLGKRFVQDEPLEWGCAWSSEPQDLTRQKKAGSTMKPDKKSNS